jgi:Ca2+-transporting ATPase
LGSAEAARRLAEHGANVLVESRGRSRVTPFLAQFKSLIVALLLAAATVAVALGDTIEAGPSSS